jgi:hypothetical protein
VVDNVCPPLPAAWTVEDIGAAFVVRDCDPFSLGFVDMARLLADVRRLAKKCGLVSVLNSQTPRLARRVFQDARACLVGAKKRQFNQRFVGRHCSSTESTREQ